MNKPQTNILVYRDKLFLKSESFIPRAYLSFERLNPVYTGHVKGPLPEHADVINIEKLKSWNRLSAAIAKQAGIAPAGLIRESLASDPKLIHAHFGKSGLYALPLARALGIPLVVTYHGGDATKHQHYAAKPWRVYNRRYKQLFKEADTLLAVSEFIKNKLIERGAPAEKIRVHYNGIDADKFKSGEKQKDILFAGRMVEKKGLDTFIEALCRASDELKGWRVRFLGDGPLRQMAEKALSTSGVEAVFEGWIDADRIPSYLSTASIVAVPSRTARTGDSEGLPMITLEGMMSGCALIGSTHAGIPEAVLDGKTGLIFQEGNSEELAVKLSRLCNDQSLRETLCQNGKARVLENFQLQIQSKKLEQMFLEIIERSGKAG